MAETMIIVGAGIAGISTGCYARMNGWRTTIFETNPVPGGLCAAWKRKGYTFDISMHMLTGSRSGPFHRMWRELGVVQDRDFFYHDVAARIEDGPRSLTIGTDVRRMEEDMLALSPADTPLTREFLRLFTGRHIADAFSLKAPELNGFLDRLKMIAAMLPLARPMFKYGRQTIQEFAARFRDPFLRDAVRFCVDSPGWPMLRYPMVAMAGFLRMGLIESGVPLGGSQKVLFRMADFYKELGGEIRYRSRVKDVLVENDRAVGVRLEDGTEHRADIVVWAGDGHTAIFDILGGRYLNDRVREMYETWLPVLPMVHVCLGVNRDFSGEPHRVLIKLEKPISVAGEDHHWLCFRHKCFDPGMAPPGKSSVEVWYATRYGWWEELARDRARYDREKKRIADLTIAALDRRWPGLAAQVEVVDVPTPATYVRYTGNWQGSPDGWYITPENMNKQTALHSLPGLAGFHMVGQWTRPFTGTVIAALSGRQLIELLCSRAGRPFLTGPAARG